MKENKNLMLKSALYPLAILSGKKFSGFNSRVLYFLRVHKHLNLKKPESLAEKITYLKLYNYNTNPLVNLCADKYRMRKFIFDKGLGAFLSDIYGVYSSVSEIPWKSLPDKCIFKMNFWYGLNVIYHGRHEIKKIKPLLNEWFNNEDFYITDELQYKVRKKVIICEKFIPHLINYKLYFCNGHCVAVLVNSNDRGIERYGSMYDPCDWTPLEIVKNFKNYKPFTAKKPFTFNKMLEVASNLAEAFPFVRIDMYEDGDRPVIGEMTFTPGAGITPTDCIINDKTIGELLKI